MATIPATFQNHAVNDAILPQWALLATNDVGAPVKAGDYNDKTCQFTGAGAATLRGSNLENPDPAVAANWFNLKDPLGADVAGTAVGTLCAQNPLWLSPISTSGAVTVGVLCKKA